MGHPAAATDWSVRVAAESVRRCRNLATRSAVVAILIATTSRASELPVVTPGAGPNWATTPAPHRQDNAGIPGAAERVIARWHTPSFETYAEGHVIGVLAFHACGTRFKDEGVAKVSFVANGGPAAVASEPTQHPTFGYWGWWARLAPAATDGPVEVRAIVEPKAGEGRVLQGGYVDSVGAAGRVLPTSEQSLVLWSNANGSYDGEVVRATPETLAAVVESLRGRANHATVHLASGRYFFPSGTRHPPAAGWCTFRPEPGASRGDVVIVGREGALATPLLAVRLQDVTIDRSAKEGVAPFRGSSTSIKPQFWFEGCDVIGPPGLGTLFGSADGVVETPSAATVRYVTRSAENRARWTGWKGGPRGTLVYGVDVEDFSEDCFTGNGLTRDFTVRKHVHLPPAHPDLWQSYGTGTNRILCDGEATECQSQLFFFDSGIDDNTDIAAVNLLLEPSAETQLRSQVHASKHLLIWHCENRQSLWLRASPTANNGLDELQTFSVRGNVFAKGVAYSDNGTGVTFEAIRNLAGWLWSDNDEGDVPLGTTDRTVRWDRHQNSRAPVTNRGPAEAAIAPTAVWSLPGVTVDVYVDPARGLFYLNPTVEESLL